ncbi:MAG: hypothetical protein VB082_10760 [Christensenella sp.]|nr:hypothetical protein [Christensenella sp.]
MMRKKKKTSFWVMIGVVTAAVMVATAVWMAAAYLSPEALDPYAVSAKMTAQDAGGKMYYADGTKLVRIEKEGQSIVLEEGGAILNPAFGDGYLIYDVLDQNGYGVTHVLREGESLKEIARQADAYGTARLQAYCCGYAFDGDGGLFVKGAFVLPEPTERKECLIFPMKVQDYFAGNGFFREWYYGEYDTSYARQPSVDLEEQQHKMSVFYIGDAIVPVIREYGVFQTDILDVIDKETGQTLLAKVQDLDKKGMVTPDIPVETFYDAQTDILYECVGGELLAYEMNAVVPAIQETKYNEINERHVTVQNYPDSKSTYIENDWQGFQQEQWHGIEGQCVYRTADGERILNGCSKAGELWLQIERDGEAGLILCRVDAKTGEETGRNILPQAKSILDWDDDGAIYRTGNAVMEVAWKDGKARRLANAGDRDHVELCGEWLVIYRQEGSLMQEYRYLTRIQVERIG